MIFNLNFFHIHIRNINIINFIAQKKFLFDILEALSAYDHNQIRFLQAKEAILNGDAYDKNRGNQMTGPSCLHIVLREFTDYYLP